MSSTKFLDSIKSILAEKKAITENGAVGYASSGSKLVDFNFKAASYRMMDDEEVAKDFRAVYIEHPYLAVLMLFYLGDVRGGLGERKSFRACLKALAGFDPEVARKILPLVPFYTRWDNVFCLKGTALESQMVKMVYDQLIAENVAIDKDDKAFKFSLLAKWMPSVNTSSPASRSLANWFIKQFNNFVPSDMPSIQFTPKAYRKILSKIRARINVLERSLCAGKWSEVDYEHVPSKANLRYAHAFSTHDPLRRDKYLAALSNGEAKINSAACFPYDIVHAYLKDWSYYASDEGEQEKPELEAMWASLPDYVKKQGSSTLVVADSSGSMESPLHDSTATAMDVSMSLAFYFSQRCSGPYKDKFISFSNSPQFIDLSNAPKLHQKIQVFRENATCSNTDVEAVFDLILNAAVKDGLKQDEIPGSVLIISDMEFDTARMASARQWGEYPKTEPQEALFEHIASKYSAAGYKMPKLIFWNVCSRTCTVPLQESKSGLILMSGFSAAAAKMALSNATDPFSALADILTGSRYQPVIDSLGNLQQ